MRKRLSLAELERKLTSAAVPGLVATLTAGCVAIALAAVTSASGCLQVADIDDIEFGYAGQGGAGGGGAAAGEGGAGGTAGFGGAGGQGGAYAQADMGAPNAPELARYYVPLPSGRDDVASVDVDLVWRDAAARPAPYDLSVRLSELEAPLLQIFTVRSSPFARAGVNLVALEPNTAYRVVVIRSEGALEAHLLEVEAEAAVLVGPSQRLSSQHDEHLSLVTPKQDPRVRIDAIRVMRGSDVLGTVLAPEAGWQLFEDEGSSAGELDPAASQQ